jgi:uncharacterized metal-binding protein YceD (DUF177 family)
VNRLVFPLSKASQAGGHSFDEEVAEHDLRPTGASESALAGVRVAGTLTAVDTEYMFRGRLTGVFERPCDRCLEPARETVDQDVTWLFEPRSVTPNDDARAAEEDSEGEFEKDEDGERARYYQGDDLDLAPHVWEEMLLAAPSKFYCSADCRGLCPNCGANLNVGECSCAPEPEVVRNSGLAALKDMFPNLPSKPVEE